MNGPFREDECSVPAKAESHPAEVVAIDRDTVCVIGPIADYTHTITDAEQDRIARSVKQRKWEFSTGRYFARHALRCLGVNAKAALQTYGRRPIWPKGICGSISHSELLGCVTVSRHDWLGGLGVDIELANAATPGVERLTLTSRELACLQKSGTRLSATKMFSAKEAVFKAVNTMTDHMIGFQDVELDFDQEAKCFSAAYSGERQANAIMACGAGLSSAYRNHVISWFLVPRSEY